MGRRGLELGGQLAGPLSARKLVRRSLMSHAWYTGAGWKARNGPFLAPAISPRKVWWGRRESRSLLARAVSWAGGAGVVCTERDDVSA